MRLNSKKNAPKKKPRRVLYILRGVEGGLPAVALNIAKGLDRNKFEPTILFDTRLQSEIRKKLLQSDIKTIDLNKCPNSQSSWLPMPRKSFDISRRLETHFSKKAGWIYLSLKDFSTFLREQAPRINSYIRAIKKNKIDLVHTHYNLNIGRPEIIAAWISGIPCISHNHGYRKFNYFDRMFARFVDTFVYISRDVAEYHASQGTKFQGTIIHNGIDINRFTQYYDTDSVRQEFGIRSDQPLVGIVGRIDWWKGHEYFLEAIARAAKQIPGLRGLIIGSLEKNVNSVLDRNRQYCKNLKLMVNSLGLSDKIIFTGSRKDVPRLIAALDVVVHASSVPEPFGLVIIEGMASGKPVVATAAGGVLDIIEDGRNGLLVPCRAAKELSKAIVEIISNPDRAKLLGLAARRHVAKKFTIQHQVTAVEKLYDDILSDHQRKKR